MDDQMGELEGWAGRTPGWPVGWATTRAPVGWATTRACPARIDLRFHKYSIEKRAYEKGRRAGGQAGRRAGGQAVCGQADGRVGGWAAGMRPRSTPHKAFPANFKLSNCGMSSTGTATVSIASAATNLTAAPASSP